MGDLSGFGDAGVEVCGILLGYLFALGVALAGALGRAFGQVCVLAGISGLYNLSLLWFFWSTATWTWQQANPIIALTLTVVGVLVAWMKKGRGVSPPEMEG